ncbi:MAG: cysteine hydrolase [Nitrososphaerota archaeon]|nr:cysteine hydrolase [Nitrososphaerota archaeon]MDG6923692.1 cysteine hydrolase [Nitrososphaerota archaeon]
MSSPSDEEIVQEHMRVYNISERDLLVGERERVVQVYRRFHMDSRKFDLKAQETALLIVDMQNHFVHPKGGSWCPQAMRQLPKIKSLIARCRKLGVRVIYTQTHFADDCVNLFPTRADTIRKERQLYEGTWGAEISQEISPTLEDRVLKTKHTPDSFVGTDLDFALRDNKVKNLIICGTNTDICCETTARSAFCLHYNVVVGSDVCSTYYGESHESALAVLRFGFARVMTSDQIIQELEVGGT